MGQQWGMHARKHGHIWGHTWAPWEQQWACMRANMAIYGGSNGACMRAYMAIYGGSNGAAMGHAYAYTWPYMGAAMGHACAHTWPYMGEPYREGREGIPYYSLPFPAPGKGITEPSFLSLPFPSSLPCPRKGRDSLPYSAA